MRRSKIKDFVSRPDPNLCDPLTAVKHSKDFVRYLQDRGLKGETIRQIFDKYYDAEIQYREENIEDDIWATPENYEKIMQITDVLDKLSTILPKKDFDKICDILIPYEIDRLYAKQREVLAITYREMIGRQVYFIAEHIKSFIPKGSKKQKEIYSLIAEMFTALYKSDIYTERKIKELWDDVFHRKLDSRTLTELINLSQ